MRGKAEDLVASLRTVCSQPVDVQEAGMRFTLDVIVLVAPARSPAAHASPLCMRSTGALPDGKHGAVELQPRLWGGGLAQAEPGGGGPAIRAAGDTDAHDQPAASAVMGQGAPPPPACAPVHEQDPLDRGRSGSARGAQGARKAKACIREYSRICGELLEVVLAQGPPADGNNSVGAALRRARHLSTGLRLAAEVHWDALLHWAVLAGWPPAEGMPYTPAGSNA